MKKLTYEEFIDRVQAVARAKRIFSPITRNFTKAFEIYQEVLAETERDIFISKIRAEDYNVLSKYKRPKCPDCGKDLALRIIKIPQGPRNVNGYQTCWTCKDDRCCYEDFSKMDVVGWLNTLELKDEEE